MAIPLLEGLALAGKDITADAWLTQRRLACYLVEDRQAQYHSTVKANQPLLLQDLVRYFQERLHPDFVEAASADHGRIETRRIWTTTTLNTYLDFPHVGQAFATERERFNKKTGRRSVELAYGLTSRPPQQATAQRLLQLNRGHWSIENSGHYILDWPDDEDRSRSRTGHGPENMTRLRRVAIKAKGVANVAQKMRELTRNARLVFDYLRMTNNSCVAASA